jgi:hypothetical protein
MNQTAKGKGAKKNAAELKKTFKKQNAKKLRM